MNTKNKRVFYQVTDGNMYSSSYGGNWQYATEKEAHEQLHEMSIGFPKNIHMSKDNREYWEKATKRFHIEKVTTITEVII